MERGEFFKPATSIPTVTLTALKTRGHSIDESENQHIAWLSLNFILKTSWVALYSVVCQCVLVRYQWHTTKFPLFSIYTRIKALCWPCTTKCQTVPTYDDPVPPSTRQYHLILTQYLMVPLIIHHFVRHSWIISPFMIHLMSHAQYTWSSFQYLYCWSFFIERECIEQGRVQIIKMEI